MTWQHVQNVLVGLLLTATLSFSVWAATSINALGTAGAVRQNQVDQLHKTMDMQQAQISTFNGILGEIKSDVGIIKTIVEERTKRREE